MKVHTLHVGNMILYNVSEIIAYFYKNVKKVRHMILYGSPLFKSIFFKNSKKKLER